MFWWESKVCWESRFCRVSRGRVTWHSEEEGAVLFCSCCLFPRCCSVTGTADASRNELELELVDAKGLLIIVEVTG